MDYLFTFEQFAELNIPQTSNLLEGHFKQHPFYPLHLNEQTFGKTVSSPTIFMNGNIRLIISKCEGMCASGSLLAGADDGSFLRLAQLCNAVLCQVQ